MVFFSPMSRVLSSTLLPLISRSPLPTVLGSTRHPSIAILVAPSIILDPATTALVVVVSVVEIGHTTHPSQHIRSVTRLGTLLLTAGNALTTLLPWVQIKPLLSWPLPLLLQTINGIMTLAAINILPMS